MTSLFQNVFNLKFCKKTTLMIWFLKMSSIVLCCTVFVVLTQDVWKKFTSKATSTNKIGEKDKILNNRPMPCLTFCPVSAFKDSGFSTIEYGIYIVGSRGALQLGGSLLEIPLGYKAN